MLNLFNQMDHIGQGGGFLNALFFGLRHFEFVFSIIGILFIVSFDILRNKYNILKIFNKYPLVIRFSIYYIILLIIILFGVHNNEQFIYVKF